METRREHLSILPAEILEEFENEALKTRSEKELFEDMNYHCDKELAITGIIIFADTEKGQDYWWDVYEKYIK